MEIITIEIIITYIIIPIGILSLSMLMLLTLFNKYLPKWFCDKLHWHLAPKHKASDGCSLSGICPRCGEKVMQDSQGNWF